ASHQPRSGSQRIRAPSTGRMSWPDRAESRAGPAPRSQQPTAPAPRRDERRERQKPLERRKVDVAYGVHVLAEQPARLTADRRRRGVEPERDLRERRIRTPRHLRVLAAEEKCLGHLEETAEQR